ncbi:MAG: pyridoxamine 5'-phosphate oxidase family protein [Holophagae bacterium]|nr:MAG: pyridoxamine 5'-phosphate oxidase family protein [Holophagae bacterium]
MRRADREITSRARIDEIIRGCEVCHLGMADGDQPYVVPVSFGYDGSSVYFHSARDGRKLDVIAVNPRVCVQFERRAVLMPSETEACGWSFAFESAIGLGVVEELRDPEAKALGLNQIMLHYSGRRWEFDPSTLARTRVWRVAIEELTGKQSSPKVP